MELMQVKEYNRQAEARWHKDCENYDHTTGGMPFLGFYTFSTPEGFNRQRGWVASKGRHHCLGINKQEAIKMLEE